MSRRSVVAIAGICFSLGVMFSPRVLATEDLQRDPAVARRFSWTAPEGWTCGITKEELPSVIAEGDHASLSMGCRDSRGALLFMSISDQSSFARAFSANDIAETFLEQFPRSWGIRNRSSRTIALPELGTEAAYVELIGVGDGVSLASGSRPTLAAWLDTPVSYQALESGRFHLVFIRPGLRASLPSDEPARGRRIAELRQIAEAFVRSFRISNARPISGEEFELSKRLAQITRREVADVPVASTQTPASLPGAMAKALTKSALTSSELALLSESRDRTGDPVARGLIEDALAATQGPALTAHQLWIEVFGEAPAGDRAHVTARFLRRALIHNDSALCRVVLETMNANRLDQASFSDGDLDALLEITSTCCDIRDLPLAHRLLPASARIAAAARRRGLQITEITSPDVGRLSGRAPGDLVMLDGKIHRVARDGRRMKLVPLQSMFDLVPSHACRQIPGP